EEAEGAGVRPRGEPGGDRTGWTQPGALGGGIHRAGRRRAPGGGHRHRSVGLVTGPFRLSRCGKLVPTDASVSGRAGRTPVEGTLAAVPAWACARMREGRTWRTR